MYQAPTHLSIEIDQKAIAAFCLRWNVTELAMFGSVLCRDFPHESDVDALVTFAPDAKRRLFVLVEMQRELSELLGRKVDLGTRDGIEQDTNPYRREGILRSAEVIYAA